MNEEKKTLKLVPMLAQLHNRSMLVNYDFNYMTNLNLIPTVHIEIIFPQHW